MSSNDTYGLYCYGIGLTEKFQQTFARYDNQLVWLSLFGDPRYAFLILYPVTYVINNKLGLNVLLTSAITEWTNAILKWIVRDDRPYWWQSTDCQFKGTTLRQYSITCESGPGFPSGHVMSTSALGLLLLIYMFKSVHSNLSKFVLLVTAVPMYSGLVLLVSASRVYIATHFPHQVAAGAVIGIYIAATLQIITNKYSLLTFFHARSILIGFAMLMSAVLLYCVLVALDLNPAKSTTHAILNCRHREWVHLDTTLFFAVIRDAAVMCGVGITAAIFATTQTQHGRLFRSTHQTCSQWIANLLLAAAFCILFLLMESFKLPTKNTMIFYFLAFWKYTVVSSSVIVIEHCFRIKCGFVDVNKKKL